MRGVFYGANDGVRLRSATPKLRATRPARPADFLAERRRGAPRPRPMA